MYVNLQQSGAWGDDGVVVVMGVVTYICYGHIYGLYMLHGMR